MDRRINRVSLAQHAFTHEDLSRLGLSDAAIARRLATGRLVPLHRGVYSVGGAPPTSERRWAAAVLACGPAAGLSHLSAAALWELRDADPEVVDVSLIGRSGRRREGIRIHRPKLIGAADFTLHRGVAVTTVDRTIINCAAVLPRRQIERMMDEAEYRRILDPGRLWEAAHSVRSVPGARRVRAILTRHEPGSTRTRSRLEERFLALVRRSGIDRPEVNAKVGRYEIDFLWRARKLAVETDGREVHVRRTSWERDRRRDAWLTANGFHVLRFGWTQVTEEPDEVILALEVALGDPGPS